MNTPPVIVLGMHRSGTTLLTKILMEYGLFFGKIREQNEESVLFLKINELLLKSEGASWSNPNPFIMKNYKGVLKYENIIKHELDKNFIRKYLGKNTLDIKPHLWGWKDPRNSITLDIWLKIFPNAKIIHIYRNPIDVAFSLQNREKIFNNYNYFRRVFNYFQNNLKYGLNIKNDPELLNLEYGIKLWNEYLSMAFKNKHNILHIKFEDLLKKPINIIGIVLKYLNIPYNSETSSNVLNIIDKQRSYSYIKNGKDTLEYRRILVKDLLQQTGYMDLIN